MRAQFFALVVPLLALSTTQPVLAQVGDAENGKDLFKVCRPCHQVGPGAKNGIGPSLNGIVGSKAGTVAGFVYSEANKQAGVNGVIWTEETLLKYLENPGAFMPGNKMNYAGIGMMPIDAISSPISSSCRRNSLIGRHQQRATIRQDLPVCLSFRSQRSTNSIKLFRTTLASSSSALRA